MSVIDKFHIGPNALGVRVGVGELEGTCPTVLP